MPPLSTCRPKWESALQMLQRARAASVPVAWGVAEMVSGPAVAFRRGLGALVDAGGLAISSEETVGVPGGAPFLAGPGQNGRGDPRAARGRAAACHKCWLHRSLPLCLGSLAVDVSRNGRWPPLTHVSSRYRGFWSHDFVPGFRSRKDNTTRNGRRHWEALAPRNR